MGMFDTVICFFPLDDPAHNKIEFQTKSLHCDGTEYRITTDGELWECGNMFSGPQEPKRRIDYHGDINIYNYMDAEPRPEGAYLSRDAQGNYSYWWTGATTRRPAPAPIWVEYIVRFTEGKVSRVMWKEKDW